jgi:capsular exopolysaccharide synthesis family protein
MNLSSFLAILWRRKWIILLTTVIAVATVTARTAMLTPLYSSSTTLRVGTSAIGSFEFLQYDLTYTDRLMNTYTHIATSTPVLTKLAEQLNVSDLPQISVAPVDDSELLVITVQDPDPVVAQHTAAALADILISQIRTTASGEDESTLDILSAQLDDAQTELDSAREEYAQLASLYAETDARVITAARTMYLKEDLYSLLLDQYEGARSSELARATPLSVVDPAYLPDTPSSPNVPLNIALGAIGGLAVGLVLAVAFENSDSTLYSSRAIEEMVDLDVIGTIPQGRGGSVLAFSNGSSPEAEAYRSLRTTLFGLRDDLGFRTLMFTSAMPNEGKSTIIANLATAIAQSGKRVIAVDADLRRPTLDKLFGVSSDIGLVNLLRKEVDPWEAMVHTEHPNLSIITTGYPLPTNPAELLSSLPVAEVLEELLQRADIVLIDAPALGPVTDAAVIAPLVDATILVVGRGRVKEEQVHVAYQKLVKVKATNIGVVINRAEGVPSYTY